MHVVCVIDDDPSVRKGVANLLKSEGYQAVCFQSGDSFLASDWIGRANCVLLDLCMPGLHGHEVQRALNGLGADVPVICMSAQATEQNVALALQQGACEFLAKPFTAEALLAAVAHSARARS